jgi:hypothetical protein
MPRLFSLDSEDEDFCCISCLSSFIVIRKNPSEETLQQKWMQCPEGHLFCKTCYDRVLSSSSPCPVCTTPMGRIRNRIAEKLKESTISNLNPCTESTPDLAKFETEGVNLCLIYKGEETAAEKRPCFFGALSKHILPFILQDFPFKTVYHVEFNCPRQLICCITFVLGLLSCLVVVNQLQATGVILLDQNSPIFSGQPISQSCSTHTSQSCSTQTGDSKACIDFLMMEGLANSIALIRNFTDKECLDVVNQCEVAAAVSGMRQPQLWLANVHEQGLCGRPADEAAAAQYLKRSADLGMAEAQYNLALYYADGTGGLARDDAAAATYLRLAASQGLTEALRRLSRQHRLGVGVVPVDREAARRYWNLAVNTTQEGKTDSGRMRLRLKWRRRTRRAHER